MMTLKKSKLTSEALSQRSRLVQNRKSAMKCRLKKKAEFEQMKDDLDAQKHANLKLLN